MGLFVKGLGEISHSNSTWESRKEKIERLKKYLKLEDGISDANTFRYTLMNPN
jgi:hypothetical protein